MIRPVTYFLVLVICGIHSKVVLDEKELLDITKNFIDKTETKIFKEIHLDLPILKNVINDPEIHNNKKQSINNADENKAAEVSPSKNFTCGNISNNVIDSKEEPEATHCIVEDEVEVKIDNGTALILTPLIENGELEEARNLSRVNSELFLGIESYSGFLTVNKTYDSNLFFWYFPGDNRTSNETPWVIWLQGGPGASSLTGLFDEIGPFKVDSQNKLIKNPFTWLQNHSLVFIDNPVGTGYSFTKSEDGYALDMATYSSHLYTLLEQLVKVYPELSTAPLFIAGESYAGKYVPSLAMEIHKRKGMPGLSINLQGLIIGNAYVDPDVISRISLPFYYLGILTREQLAMIDPLMKSFQKDIREKNSIAAKQKWNSVVTVLLFITNQKQAYNYLKDELSVGRYVTFLKSSEVKRALHVGDIHFSFVNITVNTKIAPDFLSSTKEMFEQLLEHYRVLAYCGQLDQIIPCVFSSEHFRTWKWNGSQNFLEAKRYPYIYNSKLFGYYKVGGNLTEVMVRGAGHMVPVDKPGPVHKMVTRWTHGRPLNVALGIIGTSFVEDYIKNHTSSSNIFL